MKVKGGDWKRGNLTGIKIEKKRKTPRITPKLPTPSIADTTPPEALTCCAVRISQ